MKRGKRCLLRFLLCFGLLGDPTFVIDDYLKRTKWKRSSILRQDLLNTYKHIEAKILLKIYIRLVNLPVKEDDLTNNER
jgi:hypothetical protein